MKVWNDNEEVGFRVGMGWGKKRPMGKERWRLKEALSVVHSCSFVLDEYADVFQKAVVLHGFSLGFTRVDLGLLLGLEVRNHAGFLGLLGLDRNLLLGFF